MPIIDSEYIKGRITHYAEYYKVSEITMNLIVKCESQFNPKARNNNPPIEDSSGLVQINLLAHKDVSLEQAQDIEFSLDFLARNLKAGKGSMWYNCNK